MILFHPSTDLYSAYVHLRNIEVTIGRHVLRGQTLGEVGVFPDSGGVSHLHWEVCTARHCGSRIDPDFRNLRCLEEKRPANKLGFTLPLRCTKKVRS